MADWESIALNGRNIFIAFDSDVTGKKEVRTALLRFKAYLESKKAGVRIILFPPGESEPR